MGGIYIQGPLPDTAIIVQTTAGTDIPNSQSHEYSPFELAQFSDLRKSYPQVHYLSEPSPIYNCHGLIFASRRTAISQDAAVSTCLSEDGYTAVPREKVEPGDLALYYATNGDIEHSALVLSAPDPKLGIPQVLSKWGRFAEVAHWLHVCPYDSAHVRFFRLTKWT